MPSSTGGCHMTQVTPTLKKILKNNFKKSDYGTGLNSKQEGPYNQFGLCSNLRIIYEHSGRKLGLVLLKTGAGQT